MFRFSNSSVAVFCATVSLSLLTAPAWSQSIDPAFAGAYSLVDLGSPSGVSPSYGGITMKAGDNNAILIGGAANGGSGVISQVTAVRSLVNGKNRITGFSGTASTFSTAPNIDGGLAYAPNGVLMYTGYSNNVLGQIKPGSTTPDKVIDLNTLGINSSTGTIQFIPQGFGANSGRLMIASYNSGDVYTADLVADGLGTYNISNVSGSLVNLGGSQPEGIVYIPGGNPLFANPSMLVSEYGLGRVSAYDVDALGIPILASRRTFITGLSGAEGATIDASTGDFLFSTFGGGSKVVAVRGFATPVVVPEAGSGLLALLPILAGSILVAARRKSAPAR